MLAQHVELDLAQPVFVAVEVAADFRRLLVAARHLVDSVGDPRGIRGERPLAGNRPHHQHLAYLVLGVLAQRAFHRLREDAEHRRDALLGRRQFAFHEHVRQREFVRGGKRGQDFSPFGATHRRVELDIHAGAHGGAERRHPVAFLGDLEPVEEGVVEFRQLRFFHPVQRHGGDGLARLRFVACLGRRRGLWRGDLGFGRWGLFLLCLLPLAGVGRSNAILGRPVVVPVVLVVCGVLACQVAERLFRRWNGHGKCPRLAGGHADERLRPVVVGVFQNERALFPLVERLASGFHRLVQQNPIAHLRWPLDGKPLDPLFAQVLDGSVDVRFFDCRLGNAHHQGVEGDELELRKDLEGGRVFEVLAVGHGDDVDGRRAGRRQRLGLHRILEGLLHQRRADFGQQLAAEALPHHLERHFAGAETGQLEVCCGASQAGVECLGQVAGRHGDRHLALEAVGRLYRLPHA